MLLPKMLGLAFLLGFSFIFTTSILAATLSPTPAPTPILNPSPTPTASLAPTPAYSPKIFINEFLPNAPKGEQEWVELYSLDGQSVDLKGWKIDDIEGGSSPQVIGQGVVIKPNSFTVIYFSSAKLNNSGDTVRLLDPYGFVHDAFSYGKSVKGLSFAKKSDGSWQATSALTPNGANQFVTPTPPPTPMPTTAPIVSGNLLDNPHNAYATYTIAQARQQKLTTLVLTEGVITAPPELLGVRTMFIQQNKAGIKVKLAKLDYSNLELGDKVRVRGELREGFNEKYIKDNGQTVTFLEKVDLVIPNKIKTGKVQEEFEGGLVEVNGQVVKTSGATFYLDDGSGQIKIYIKPTTDIEKPKMRKGYFARVVGIVSQYKEDYRILPRFQEDLLVSKAKIADDQAYVEGSFVETEDENQPNQQNDLPKTQTTVVAQPSSQKTLQVESGEVLGASTTSNRASELPATGVDPLGLFDLFLAVGLFYVNIALLFRWQAS